MEDLTSPQTLDGMPVQVCYSVDDDDCSDDSPARGAISILSVLIEGPGGDFPVDAACFSAELLMKWADAILSERAEEADREREDFLADQEAWEAA